MLGLKRTTGMSWELGYNSHVTRCSSLSEIDLINDNGDVQTTHSGSDSLFWAFPRWRGWSSTDAYILRALKCCRKSRIGGGLLCPAIFDVVWATCTVTSDTSSNGANVVSSSLFAVSSASSTSLSLDMSIVLSCLAYFVLRRPSETYSSI